MFYAITIISVTLFLLTIGLAYYLFIYKKETWKKLQLEVEVANANKWILLQTIDGILLNKAGIEKDFLKFQVDNKLFQDKLISESTDFQNKLKNDIIELQLDANKLRYELEKLSGTIKAGQEQYQIVLQEKKQAQFVLQEIKSDIEKLNSIVEDNTRKAQKTTAELALLTEQKHKLQTSVESISNQFILLKKDEATLAERKSDLEKENSHLSLEIAKKKILIREL